MCLALCFYTEIARVSLMGMAVFVLPKEFISESETKVKFYVVLQGA